MADDLRVMDFGLETVIDRGIDRGSDRGVDRASKPAGTQKTIRFEPTQRRLRVEVGGEWLVDTTRGMILIESGHEPVYYFPRADVRFDLLQASSHTSHCPYKGKAAYWHVVLKDRRIENAVWGYPKPLATAPGHVAPTGPGGESLSEYVAFYWNKMDRWFEEDEEVFVHARDPYKRIDSLASKRRVEVVVGGEIIAASRDAIFLFETGLPVRYYLPRSDIRADILADSAQQTRCPYKGLASYHRVVVNGIDHGEIAWYYAEPIPETCRIKGRVAFYNEKVDAILLDGIAVPKLPG
ncbi:MAG: DUF427 domain-containing protein [Dongiaceae bacterium]